jgi:hypothetical protein
MHLEGGPRMNYIVYAEPQSVRNLSWSRDGLKAMGL